MAASCLEAQSNRQMNQMSGGHKPSFTATQGQYLAFIDAYTRVNLRPPAEADLQCRFGVSPPSVHQMILTLERAGFIRRQPGVPRSIEVLVPPQHLPVLEMPAQSVKTSVPKY
jgi:DNA-binding MarR family transcriptional regulator